MNRTILLFGLTAVIASPGLAQSSATPQVAPKIDNPKQKVLCKSINSTGSRISSDRVCKTQAEWDADADATRDDLEHGPRRPSGDQLSGPN